MEWGGGGGWGGGEGEIVNSWNAMPDEDSAGGNGQRSSVSGEAEEDERKPVQEERRAPLRETGGALRLGKKQTGKKKKEEEGKKNKSKNTLSEADRVRLEEQATWSREPDFFADMGPSVAKTTGVSSPVLSGVESPTPTTKSSSLQYHHTAKEEVSIMAEKCHRKLSEIFTTNSVGMDI